MSTPLLDVVFNYLATLIAERGSDEQLLVSQIQNAIQYKYPDFTFAANGLPGLKEFVVAGEKAGYFKLVNTGNFQTAYLAPGTKRPVQTQARGAQRDMAANDPRRTRWMTLAIENLLIAERADQILDTIKGIDALTPEFNAFLGAQIKATPVYPTRGKIQRVRDFLAILRVKGEAEAIASWKMGRAMLRLPSVPTLEGSARAHSLLLALLQANVNLDQVPVEQLDNLFLAVLNFSREQATRNRSWDWVVALDMLEEEVRAVPRPVPIRKQGLFGGKQPATPANQLDDKQIAALTDQLRQMAGLSQTNDTPIWQAYLQTTNLDGSYRFLVEHPTLAQDEHLVTWLEDQIGESVATNAVSAIKNLANKAALVIAVRQYGLDTVRQHSADLKSIYDSVIEGAKLLGILFNFINAPDTESATMYYSQQHELADANIELMFEEQLHKAAQQDDIARFRLLSQRMDLWSNLLNFGIDQGMSQHEIYLAANHDESQVQAEMGFMLLLEATTPDERQDIISRFPPVATAQGLALASHDLDLLSFNHADADVYNHHFEVKRLIERCIQLGIDRALAEMQ